MTVNIQQQETATPPCSGIYEFADRQLEAPALLSNSILLGFPYADVREMGSATLAVTDGDQQSARAFANELARRLWKERAKLVGDFISIDAAIQMAHNLPGPVCLLDMGDNVGGGSPADSTWLVWKLNQCERLKSLACLYDPEAVAICMRQEINSNLRLSVGGNSGQIHGDPLKTDFTLLGLYSGKFEEAKARHGGFTVFDQGPTAVVKTARGLTLILTSKRMAPFSLGQVTSCGLDPKKYDVIVAKGVVAPVAAYRDVCRHFIRVDTPGVTSADLSRLQYEHRRAPLFPFEQQAEWAPERR